MILIDDDIFYRSTMIEDMYNYCLQYPNTVISQYCKKMKWVADKLESYALWPKIEEATSPNLHSFFGTGGGTLIPPFTLDAEVINRPLFMSLTPTADDIWINAMCRLKKTKITMTNYHSSLLSIINIGNMTLESVNNGLDQNNKQIKAVSEYFIKIRGIDPFQKIEE
jgi:hypothetical protein